MNVISKNNIVPSERLIEKYKSSKQSEKLNLPDFEYLNSKIEISQEKYDYIKEQLKSFNQNILYSCPNKITEIQSSSHETKYIYIGQVNEQDKTKSGIGVLVSSEGDYYHCFWSNNWPCYQGVIMTSKGDYFEGIFNFFDSNNLDKLHKEYVNMMFVGDLIAGKSSLYGRLIHERFICTTPTLGIDIDTIKRGF